GEPCAADRGLLEEAPQPDGVGVQPVNGGLIHRCLGKGWEGGKKAAGRSRGPGCSEHGLEAVPVLGVLCAAFVQYAPADVMAFGDGAGAVALSQFVNERAVETVPRLTPGGVIEVEGYLVGNIAMGVQVGFPIAGILAVAVFMLKAIAVEDGNETVIAA